MIALEKDLIITCPSCQLHIALSLRDQFVGEKIAMVNFEPLAGPLIPNMTCPRCKTCYSRVCSEFDWQQLHTVDGWRPKTLDMAMRALARTDLSVTQKEKLEVWTQSLQ